MPNHPPLCERLSSALQCGHTPALPCPRGKRRNSTATHTAAATAREARAEGRSGDLGPFPAGYSRTAIAEVKPACPDQGQPQGCPCPCNHAEEMHTLPWKSFLPSSHSGFAQSCAWGNPSSHVSGVQKLPQPSPAKGKSFPKSSTLLQRGCHEGKHFMLPKSLPCTLGQVFLQACIDCIVF